MAGTYYLCEAAGARILRVGQGITQVGGTYELDVTTWDQVPAGEVGDVAFRAIDVAIAATNGYNIGITPILDGVAQPEQRFSGAGTGEFQCQAFVAGRGTRVAARVRTLGRSGDVELHSIGASGVVLRKAP